MPKRTDISSIMIIGAGPIVIGQACEFDYSGTQACKALKEEGYRVVLVNSNPATIMTDPAMADATYIEPITWQTVAKIIEKERPDALLPTMGGQTGLNTSLALEEMGVLEKFGVEMIGAKRDAIEMAEDRKLFREAMDRIGLENPKATIITAPTSAEARPRPTRIAVREAALEWGPMALRLTGDLEIDGEGHATGDVHVQAQNWQEMLAVARASGQVADVLADGVEAMAVADAGVEDVGHGAGAGEPQRAADCRAGRRAVHLHDRKQHPWRPRPRDGRAGQQHGRRGR